MHLESQFRKSAVTVETMRFQDDAVQQESDILRFPSVDRLIAATLPFESAEDLIERLISAWIEAFSVEECVLLWRDSFNRTGEMCLGSQSDEFRRHRFRADHSMERVLRIAQSTFNFEENWRWLPLIVEHTTVGYVGFPDESPLPITSEWIATSARLLATALTWEWNLQEKKLAALGEYAAGAGHEINNPLAAIKGRTAQLLQEEDDPHRRHLLQTIGAQVYRIRDMIGDSMLFAHPPALQPAKFNISQLLESVVHRFADEFAERKISLWGNRETSAFWFGDETQLSIVIAELLRNALQAVENGGRIQIDCYHESANDGNWLILKLADNGSGLSRLEREHCFDPFFSGPQAGRRLGFGLSKCWRIVTQHQGTITVSESPAGLTEFTIRLPCAADGN